MSIEADRCQEESKRELEIKERQQKLFEENGGKGDAQKFILLGAEGGVFDKDEPWKRFTPEQKKLWNKLNGLRPFPTSLDDDMDVFY